MNSQERSASLNVEGLRLVQVGQACQAFEAAWKSGSRPQVEAFLGDAQGELRSALLQELLLLDIRYRQKAGELPAAKDYFKRLPSSDGVLVQGVFCQSPTQAGQVQAETSAIGPERSKSVAGNAPASCGPQQPEGNPAQGKPEHEGLTAEKLIGSLTESGLMSPEEVDTFLTSLPAELRPTTGRQVAEALYRHKRLTKFQVQAVYQGKTRGLVMGNYVVLDRLGKGGMGEVYKAQHRRMERVVALKVLPSQSTKSEEAVKRFHREVKAAARLSHPNIVTAHDADEHKGVHFLVMEYVDGKDLAALVKERGPLPVVQAVDCVLQAARALEYAHQQGVVHRDIKPHNLLLDRKGTVKVLDMGLARIEETVGAATTSPEDGLTMSGQVMGTLDYMSPEQALDTKTADCRSDIYALGCTLHYLLTGSPPYRTDTVAKKILAHQTHPVPSLCAVRQDVPASLDELFRTMLAKNPAERPQSMSELVAAIEQCLAATKASLAPYAPTVSFFADNVADSSGASATLPPTGATVPVPPIPTTASRTTPNLATLRWMLAFMMLGLVTALLVGILLERQQPRLTRTESLEDSEAAAEGMPKQPAQESPPQAVVGALPAASLTSSPSEPSAVKPPLVQHGLGPDPGREKPAAPATPSATEAAATVPRTSPGFDKTGLPKEDSPKPDSSTGGMTANTKLEDGADSRIIQNPPQDSKPGTQNGPEYRVTVISEPKRLEEVLARLGQERVIWVRLNKSQVSRGQIEQLREWVREGGVLWTDTGFASAEAMEPEFGFSMMPNPNNSRTGSCRPASAKRTHPIVKDLPYEMNYTLAEDRFLIRVVPGERGKEPVHIRLLLETPAEKRKLRTGVCGICYFGRGKVIYRPVEVAPTTAGEQFERNLREYSSSLAQKAASERTPAESDAEMDDADLQ